MSDYTINPFTGEFDANGGGGDVDLSSLVERVDWNQNGFENLTDSTIAFTDATRTFSIQPTATNFSYFVAGIEYISTGDTVVIDDTEGIWVVYYDDDTLTAVNNPNAGQVDTVIRSKSIVSILYWDSSEGEAIYLGEERHGKDMSPSTHAYLHFTEGLRYLSGLGLNTLDTDQNGNDDAHAQFGIDTGGVTDEDLYHYINAVTSTVGCPIYYMLGANADWQKDVNAGFSVRTYDGTSNTRLAWNEYTGGAWQLTEVDNNDFVLCHIFATTEKDTPMIAIMGQDEYNTKGAARTGAETEIRQLLLNDILFPEVKPIATVIFQTGNSKSNAVKGETVTTDEGDDYVDWRNESISRAGISTSDHGSLTGLTDDDHPQYAVIDQSRASSTASSTITYDGDFVDTVIVGSRTITYTNDGTNYTSWTDGTYTWTPTYVSGKLTAIGVT